MFLEHLKYWRHRLLADCYLVFYFSGSVRVQRVVRGKVLKVVGAGKVIADWCI